jgi:hypothetical protein
MCIYVVGLFKGKFYNEKIWISLPPTNAAQAIGILNLLFRLASAECTDIP